MEFKTNIHCNCRVATVGFCVYSGYFRVPANCSEEVTTQLTAYECIKQACLLSANSASTLLTSTVAALLDTSKKYKESLAKLISLLEESNMRNALDDELWDSIIQLRQVASEQHAEFHKFLVYMENVNKLVEATIEVAFNAESDYLCKVLCERIHSAEEEIKKCKLEIEILEQEYLQAQVQLAKQKQTKGEQQQSAKEQVVLDEL